MYTYQYYRDNPQEFKKYKLKDTIPLNCSECGKLYYSTKEKVRRSCVYIGHTKNFCSKACQNFLLSTSTTEPCKNCGKNVTREPSARKSSINVFCNSSCAASYNNTHKTHGTRRSKLEIFLEEQLRVRYPLLKIEANGKEAIESELDFYFPELRFAIELNGPTHYEPIYGQDKFEKIQNNDKQKIIRCYEKGIELMIIDVSKVHNMNKARKEHYLGIVTNVLDALIKRL